jgi:hypothetical protein
MLLFIGISENIIWVEVVESNDEIESTNFSISEIDLTDNFTRIQE